MRELSYLVLQILYQVHTRYSSTVHNISFILTIDIQHTTPSVPADSSSKRYTSSVVYQYLAQTTGTRDREKRSNAERAGHENQVIH